MIYTSFDGLFVFGCGFNLENTVNFGFFVTSCGSGVPPLPNVLVGDQSDPRAGPNKSGKRHASGPLLAEHGGTGSYPEDLELLTGGTRPRQKRGQRPSRKLSR